MISVSERTEKGEWSHRTETAKRPLRTGGFRGKALHARMDSGKGFFEKRSWQ